jgi:hypothetical protein
VDARAQLCGRLVVVLLAGLFFLRVISGSVRTSKGWRADTNPTASWLSSSVLGSAAAASSAVSSVSGSASSRSSGIGWPLRTDRP